MCSKDNSGLTPLHIAVSKGNVGIYHLLIGQNLNLNVRDN